MIMEAMRLSLLEHEEQQRKEKEAKEVLRSARRGSGAMAKSEDDLLVGKDAIGKQEVSCRP